MSSNSAFWTAVSSVRFDLLGAFVLGYVVILAELHPVSLDTPLSEERPER